jgi:LuxR family transcriptional regulator, maltose regulon positive regulatory protein
MSALLRRFARGHGDPASPADPAVVAYASRLVGQFAPGPDELPPGRAGAEIPGGLAPAAEALSQRELEVLDLVAAGLSTRQIAARLVISEGTVKRHINNINGKLEVHSRTQAIARARELHLLENR